MVDVEEPGDRSTYVREATPRQRQLRNLKNKEIDKKIEEKNLKDVVQTKLKDEGDEDSAAAAIEFCFDH